MGLSRQAPSVFISIDGLPAPDAYQVLTIRRGIGAGNPDTAIIEERSVAHESISMQFRNMDVFSNALVQIVVNDINGASRLLHYGRISAQRIQLNESGESVQYESRLSQDLYGKPLHTHLCVDPQLKVYEVNYSVRFNPIVEGIRWPNMFLAGVNPFVFERDAQSQKIDPRVSYWTLPLLIEYLCIACNAAQKHVINPTLAELSALPPDPSLVNDYEPPFGAFLPEILDHLLLPLGFMWYIDYSTPPPKIRVVSRNTGKGNIPLLLQIPLTDLNNEETNVLGYDLKFDSLSHGANRVVVLGDAIEIESTFTLVPGWDPDYDDIEAKDTMYGSEFIQSNEGADRAWRVWVLNEGRDYPDYDATDLHAILTAAYNPPPAIGIVEPGAEHEAFKRRRFWPTITQLEDRSSAGQYHGVDVEYRIVGDANHGNWQPVTNIGENFRILRDECGIEFTNPDQALTYLRDQVAGDPASLEFRVTASVRFDVRLAISRPFGAAGAGAALDGLRREDVYTVIETSDRFRFRKIHADSKYFGTTMTNSETDDTLAIAAYANQVYTNWIRASVQGSVTLSGVDDPFDYLAVTISGMQSRGIALATHPKFSFFPICVGLDYDMQQQTTTLTLETFRRRA